MNSIRKLVEETYPEINFYLCCNDNLWYLLDKNSKNINISSYKKADFAVVYELKETLGGEDCLETFKKEIQ